MSFVVPALAGVRGTSKSSLGPVQPFVISASGSDRNLLLSFSLPQLSAEALGNLQYLGPRRQAPAIRSDSVGTHPVVLADRATAQVGQLRR